ncbi:lipocalin family protein [Corynebacterium qintianiae]|uniref:lipocalin family protein n=1 Tax=Corynebacterium qintianiae TaxID=2709392 RepID=UPI0013EDA80D|nr:lipocalin family protein [Corynebacterium qintianiae]
MRHMLTILAAAVLATMAAPAASAQDVFDGGRIAGASSQIVPQGLPVPGGELPEAPNPVDLERYAGTWYQVAAVPQPFTLQCAYDTKADYAVVDATTISVRNSCGTLVGPGSAIEGAATVRGDASLRVNFPGVPFQDPNGPVNYRVTYLADDYSLAIVGDPYRASGFVLSRTPGLTPEQWKLVRGTVESRGWWPCAFLTVPMTGGRGDVVPLCVL